MTSNSGNLFSSCPYHGSLKAATLRACDQIDPLGTYFASNLKARNERTKLLEKLEQIIESELRVNLVKDSLNITVYNSNGVEVNMDLVVPPVEFLANALLNFYLHVFDLALKSKFAGLEFSRFLNRNELLIFFKSDDYTNLTNSFLYYSIRSEAMI
jgi:hypothetical protein